MEITTLEASKQLGVNQSRVRALIASGSLRARMVGGQWLVDSDSLERQASLIAGRATGRSMSARTAWALAAMVDGYDIDILNAAERYRLRKRLATNNGSAAVVQRWLSHRFEEATKYRIANCDAESLLSEDGVVATGVSAIEAYDLGLGAGGSADAYMDTVSREHLVRKFAMIPSQAGNMTVRTVDHGWHLDSAIRIGDRRVAPRLIVGADLADDIDARTSSAGRRLIESVLRTDGHVRP